MAWDDAKKEKAAEMYLALEPNGSTSMECVKEVAEKLGETPNSVRMILTAKEVYIKKDPAVKTPAADGEKPKATRVSKEASADALVKAIEEAGETADMEIISKLTGKAAVYFTGLVTKLSK
jgi:predicted transcriptional regulator